MASLSLRHIYKIYQGDVTAVKDFNLEIEDKEFIVFVGPSGCGKSTTLRMIAGLEDISKGELYIGDTLVNDVEPKERDIAMVFQNYALYPHMSVYDNMAFALKLRKMPKDEIEKKVTEAAKILDIEHLLKRKPKALSGGQRQRVALGRAIVRNPKVFLMDEPLSNLDAKLRVQMRTEISKLYRKLQTTFIYVTHDQVEAMTMGTRIVVMKDGIIQQVDTPQNIYNYPTNLFVAGFMGSPQMNFIDGVVEKSGNDLFASFNGNKIKFPANKYDALKSYIGKDGKEKLIPIQKKDENGKNLYSIEKGKFLNCDQFWKDKGFKTSFAKIQDDYNKFITSKGFNLDRGQIGGNKYHQTKAEKYLEELQEENKLMELELNNNKALNEVEISYKEKISNVDTNPLLNPEKGKIIGYKEKDINNLSKYSKEITKDNLNKSKIIEQNEIKLESKQKQIDKLNTEIKNLKSGKTLIEKDKIIENQNLIIKEKDDTIKYQNTIISSLRNELTELKENIDTIISNVKNVAIDLYKALKITLGFDVDKNQKYDYSAFKDLSKKVNKKYERDKSDDFEL